MELWIKKAATDSDWDVIYVNISSCCSSPSLLAWFDLLSRLRFLFTITHSCLIASCSANRVHFPLTAKESSQPYTYLVTIFPLHLCLLFVIHQPAFQGPLQGTVFCSIVWLFLFCLFSSPHFICTQKSISRWKRDIFHKLQFYLHHNLTEVLLHSTAWQFHFVLDIR